MPFAVAATSSTPNFVAASAYRISCASPPRRYSRGVMPSAVRPRAYTRDGDAYPAPAIAELTPSPDDSSLRSLERRCASP
jgi:hypothetical protein